MDDSVQRRGWAGCRACAVAASLFVVGCGSGRGDSNTPDEGGITATGGLDGGGSESMSATTGTLLDVGAADTGEPTPCDGEGCEEHCKAIDLLFVIDNSKSMEPYQIALGQAFPAFADTLIEALPENININVGVTSTEMGYAPWAMNCRGGSATAPECWACGNDVECDCLDHDDYPPEHFYETPDTTPSTKPGAQGRLFPAQGKEYFSINTSAPATEVGDLKSWFVEASHIGEGGSNIEMSLAGAAWAFDPANDTTNAGFIRDENTVTVLFFVQDEHDQTPSSESAALIEKITAAKSECGGLDCLVAGGFVDQFCLPTTALDGLFDAIGGAAILETLPEPEDTSPETFQSVLRDTLTSLIVSKCNEIAPEG